MLLSSSPYVLHALPISFFLIWSPKYSMSTDHSVSLCHLPHSTITSSLIGPNTFLSTLLPNTLSLHPLLTVGDQVSHPYKTKGKIIVSYYLELYIFGQQTGRQKILHQIIASIPWLQSALNFFVKRILIRKGCSQIIEVFHPFKWFITYIYMLWFCTACWFRDMTIYLVFLSFSSRPTSLLTNTEAPVFSFTVRILAPTTWR